MVDHKRHAARQKARADGSVVLSQRMHLAAECDDGAFELDADVVCLALGLARQRCGDLPAQVAGTDPRLDGDVVDETAHPQQRPDGPLGARILVASSWLTSVLSCMSVFIVRSWKKTIQKSNFRRRLSRWY